MLLDLTSEFYSWIRGALLILALYHLLIYFQNKKKQYLFYSLYLVCFLVYFLRDINSPWLPVFFYINFSIQYLGYAAYVGFVRSLLKTKKNIPEWDKLLVIERNLLLIVVPVFILIQYFSGYSSQEKLFTIIAPIISVFGILTYIVLNTIKGKHVTYFIIGSVAYLILANISFLGPYTLGNEYFLEKGIFNKDVAKKFKDNVLSQGGIEDPMTLYKRFRGKEPRPDALLKRAGLIAK